MIFVPNFKNCACKTGQKKLHRAKTCTVSEDQYRTPSKEHYGNEVHLTGKKPLSKCCQPLDFWYTFLKGLDLSMLEIWEL